MWINLWITLIYKSKSLGYNQYMFRKKPLIKYQSAIQEYPNILSMAKTHIPEWYKKIPRWKNNKMFTLENGMAPTVKQCVPFMDALSCGYIVTLPYDLYVHNNNGSPYLVWRELEFPPKWREDVANENVVPAGHYSREYIWDPCVSIEVPEGYSMLLTHPLNRHDLPFTTLSGIIDGGFATPPHGSFPFYIKTGFDGVIEQGTPIMQIIPFKQDIWQSEQSKDLLKKGLSSNQQSSLKFTGWYKNTIWNRKDYQ